MAREEGTFPFAANFERKKSGMMDATQFVPQFSDLLSFTGANYIANGFPVCVATTTTYYSKVRKRGWYQCVDPNNLNLVGSWEYMGGVDFEGTSGKVAKFNSNGSIEDSNIQELSNTLWLFGSYLRFTTRNLSEERQVSWPDKGGQVALLSDIQGSPDLDNRDTLDPSESYLDGDDIYYIDSKGEIRYFEVLVDFSTPSTIGDDYVNGKILDNTLLEVYVSSIINIKPFNIDSNILYTQNSITFDSVSNIWYIALIDNSGIQLDDNNVWKPFIYPLNDNSNGYDAILSAGKILDLLDGKVGYDDSELLYLGNVGSVFLTVDLLENTAPYSSAILGQCVESDWQIATKALNGWAIIKKNKNEKIVQNISCRNTSYWNGSTKTLDVSGFKYCDIIKVNTSFSGIAVTAATQASPCVVTIGSDDIHLFKNDDLITVSSASGMTEINGDWMIKNIDYGDKTFELYETDGTTPADTSAALSYGGLGVATFTNGKLELNIEKISGVQGNSVLELQFSANEEPTIKRVALTSATTDEIETDTNSDINLVGRDDVSDWVKIRRVGDINLAYNTKNW